MSSRDIFFQLLNVFNNSRLMMASKSGSDPLTTEILARIAKEFDGNLVKIFLVAFMKNAPR